MNETTHLDCLYNFYNNLKLEILKEKGNLIKHSVLLTFLKLHEKFRNKTLNKSSISKNEIGYSDLNKLITGNLIRQTSDSIGQYTITAFGIWEIESKKGIITINDLIGYIDKWKFQLSKDISINDLEKIILLSMICLRNFSDHAVVRCKYQNRQRGINRLNIWLKIFKETYRFLLEEHIIRKKIDFIDKGNEHFISYTFRHANRLPVLTNNIFVFKGQQKYYLDVVGHGEQQIKDRLIHLFKLIFNNNLTFEIIGKIDVLCHRLNMEYCIQVVDQSPFNIPKYKKVISDSLRESIL